MKVNDVCRAFTSSLLETVKMPVGYTGMALGASLNLMVENEIDPVRNQAQAVQLVASSSFID
jgi:hypothetical protein